MKMRKSILSLMALVATVFTGCTDDDNAIYLDEIQVSTSYISIPMEGGSTEMALKTAGDWEFEKIFQKIITREDGTKDTIFVETPDWLKVSQLKGNASRKDTLVFSADATLDGRATELLLTCAGQTQHINVIQGLSTVSEATCAEVIAGPDSKTYRVKGICTGIANTTYGNWYLTDETGSIYIYGTYDKNGKEKNFSSWGMEVGDEVIVEGPKLTFGSTVELVNVTVVALNKSLVKVDSTYVGGVMSSELPLEGGELTAYVTCKGQGVSVDIPEDAKEWLSIASIKNGGTEVVFKAAPNTGGDRSTTITFTTTDGKKNYTSQVDISQKGAIVEASIADFLAAANKNTQYRLTGTVTGITDMAKGRFTISDYSGEVYVFNCNLNGNDFKLGDIVTLTGKYDKYKETEELVSGVVEKSIAVKEVSIPDFRAAADSKGVYYMITGKVVKSSEENTKWDLDVYGNFALQDDNGNEVYVYGLTSGWGGPSKQCGALNLHEGDIITIIGYHTSYNGLVEVGGAYLYKVIMVNAN